MVAKAELHVHLEGTITPTLVKQLATRNNLKIPADLFADNDTFLWNDFSEFLTAFDKAASVIRVAEDYRDITFDYLRRCAEQGGIYVEMMGSPDHAKLCGLSYPDYLEGMVRGIDDAHKAYGITGRIISTCVRHFGVDSTIEVAKLTVKHPHPYVIGFGMGGDEVNFPPHLFKKAYQIAADAGLGLTTHAGEWTGPDMIREAIDSLKVTRLGHGVRIIEDPTLMDEVKDKGITLECCPTSNIALKVYPSYQEHPFLKLYRSGLKMTLNSDDPPFFAATLGGEYEVASQKFGLDDEALTTITQNAIHASFVEDSLKQDLLKKIAK